MGDIGRALTRKFGPLPAWAWALIGAVGVYWYRNRTGTTASSTTAVPTVATDTTPQSPITLQPGESVYDPNSGTLTSAPGGTGGGDTSGNSDLATAINGLTSALAAGIDNTAAGRSGVPGSGGPAKTGTRRPRKPRKPSKTRKPRLYGLGAGKGYVSTVKRTAKPKATAKPPTDKTGKTSRSASALRGITRKRNPIKPGGASLPRDVVHANMASRARTRTRVPMTRTTAAHHPQPAHPTPHAPTAATNPHLHRARPKRGK